MAVYSGRRTEPPIDGTKIRLGGEEFIIPPLNLRQVKRYEKLLGELGGLAAEEFVERAAEVIHAAMARNYPDITRELVHELVDLGNLEAVMKAVRGVVGDFAPGEAQPVPANRSTGTGSTR